MAEFPILFSGPMVRALIEGRKTQTRRLAWRPADFEPPAVGDRFVTEDHKGRMFKPTVWQRREPGDWGWVRETACIPDCAKDRRDREWITYFAGNRAAVDLVWTPAIHMPRWASRFTIVVTDKRIHRVREITPADARAEGFGMTGDGRDEWASFLDYWASLHGQESSDRNDEVVALTFTVHHCNIDAMERDS